LFPDAATPLAVTVITTCAPATASSTDSVATARNPFAAISSAHARAFSGFLPHTRTSSNCLTFAAIPAW
jgi:hypothetical protein